MLKLIRNEWCKNFFRVRNYISIFVIFIFVVLFISIPSLFSSQYTSESFSKDSWAEEVNERITFLSNKSSEVEKSIKHYAQSDPESMQLMISEAEKSEIAEEINRLNYSLEQNIRPVSNNNLYDNLLSITQMKGLITVLIVIIAVSLITDEFSSGTIKLLLIRSASRSKILLSKFITLFAFLLFYLGMAILFTLLVSLLISDINSSPYYIFAKSIQTFDHVNFYTIFAQNIIIRVFSIMMISIIAFSISVIFVNKTLALPLTLALYFSALPTTMFLKEHTNIVHYFWFANWDLEKFLIPFKYNQSMLTENITLGNSLLVNVLYCLPLLIITFYIFEKKEIYN